MYASTSDVFSFLLAAISSATRLWYLLHSVAVPPAVVDILNWVNINGLFLNLKKTNYMIFTRKRHSILDNYDPYIGGKKIERKPVTI